MLNRARLFDPYEYGETFLDADMAIKQRQLPSPLDATHHIHLIDCDWEKISSFDDNIATIRKWVQVMVFGADESESDDELGNEDGMAPARSRPCSAACPFGVLCSWPSAGEPGPERHLGNAWGAWGLYQ